MKRRREFLMDLLEDLGPTVFRTVMTTIRWRLVEMHKDPEAHLKHGPVIWAFWHAHQALAAYVGRNRDVRALISAHRDGEIAARLMKGLGYDPVRGSTTEGGIQALMDFADTATRQDFAITPDGPLGPREHVQPGIILLAQVTGRPILPVGAAEHPCIRARTWDRFVVPLPFSTVAGVLGDLIFVPPDISPDDRSEYCERLETALARLTERAEDACRQAPPGTMRHNPTPVGKRCWR